MRFFSPSPPRVQVEAAEIPARRLGYRIQRRVVQEAGAEARPEEGKEAQTTADCIRSTCRCLMMFLDLSEMVRYFQSFWNLPGSFAHCGRASHSPHCVKFQPIIRSRGRHRHHANQKNCFSIFVRHRNSHMTIQVKSTGDRKRSSVTARPRSSCKWRRY